MVKIASAATKVDPPAVPVTCVAASGFAPESDGVALGDEQPSTTRAKSAAVRVAPAPARDDDPRNGRFMFEATMQASGQSREAVNSRPGPPDHSTGDRSSTDSVSHG